MITYQTEGVEMPHIKKRETTEWVKAVAQTYGKKVGEIAYIFCSDEKILEVNRQYLQHDYYTDIITFDYTEGNRIAGDLFISLDTVRTNAEQFGATYDTELHRVIIHGILHLCIVEQNWFAKNRMEHRDTKAQSSIFLRGQSSRRKDLVRRSLSFLYLFLRGSVPLCSSFNHTPLLNSPVLCSQDRNPNTSGLQSLHI